MARPMPREEPVTIATRPVKSNRLVKISSDGRRAASTIALFAGPTLEGGSPAPIDQTEQAPRRRKRFRRRRHNLKAKSMQIKPRKTKQIQ
jgi:hypothetical protein